MSFSSIRSRESVFSRRHSFWNILFSDLEGLDPDNKEDIARAHDLLDGFRLGLRSFPYKDDGQNGTTAIVKVQKDSPSSGIFSGPEFATAKDYNWLLFTGGYHSLMDFLVDFFGLDSDRCYSYHMMKKKYRDSFQFSYLSSDGLVDFVPLAMRAARLILRSPETFDDPTVFIEFCQDSNQVFISKLKKGIIIHQNTETSYF